MKKIYFSVLLGFINFFLSAQTDFITTWKTDNPGVSADNQITIPTFPGETYNYSVDWGDGSSDSSVTGDITHTYAAPGTYTVSIAGVFPRIYFNYDGIQANVKDKDKILSVVQWGTGQWTSMENAFNGCTNIDVVAPDTPNLSNVTSMAGMFYLCSSLVGNVQFNNWNTGNVSNFLAMFRGASTFDQFVGGWDMSSAETLVSMFQEATIFNQDIGAWDIGQVSNLGAMFQEAHAFNQNLNDWNTSNVTNMSVLFNGALNYNQPLNNWNVSNVVDMQGMFANSSFNQDIGNWNVGNVTNMSEMFTNIFAFNQDISGWDVSKVTQMFSMFEGVMDFDQNLGSWDVSKVTNMERMFAVGALSPDNYDSTLIGWYQLPGLQENVVFDGGASQYCNSVVERLKLMYEKNWTITDEGRSASFCADRPFITTWKTDNLGISEDNALSIPIFGGPYSIDWGDGNIETGMFDAISHTYATVGEYTVSITGDAISMQFNSFPGNEENSDATKLLEINQWGDIQWSSMSGAYAGCTNMDVVTEDVPDLSGVTSLFSMFVYCNSLIGNEAFNAWDVSGLNNLTQVFSDCTLFNANVSKWDVSSITGMGNLFNNCINFNQDITKWNVSKVTEMYSMFSGATAFNQNIGDWDVSNVTDMGAMFQSSGFNQDISNWNVSNVIDMRFMFNLTPNFNQDIGGWDVSKVTDMTNMLSGTDVFDQDISEWNVSSVTSMKGMFVNAKLFNQDISNWDVSNVTDMFWMFLRANSFDQDLGGWNVSNVTDMTMMFFDAGLSTNNYDSLLKGWSSLPSLQNNVIFDAGNSQYCASEAERQSIMDTYGWTITDAGSNTSCQFITTWKTDNPGITEDNQISIPTFSGETYNYTVDWGDGTSDSNVTGDIVHTYSQPGTYQVSILGEFPRIYFNNLSFPTATEGDEEKILRIQQWGANQWTSMNSAFAGCKNLELIAGDIPDLSNLSSMYAMFYACEKLGTEGRLVDWDVSNVTNTQVLFYGTNFNQDIGGWDVSNVMNMNGMFALNPTFNQDIGNWDVSNVRDLSGLLSGAIAFNQPLNSWDVSNVSNFNGTFANTTFNQPLSNWNTENATDMSAMFASAASFNQDIGKWNVSSVENMGGMFNSATSFNQNLENWDTSSVTVMTNMFASASTFNQDISMWDVSNVVEMTAMFARADSFNQSLEDWNVANVTDMRNMFLESSSFDQSLGGWDIGMVVNMADMFTGASLSSVNYDNTLIGWSTQTLNDSVSFAGGNSQYCESADARQNIIDTYGWTITDDGENPLCNQDNDSDGVLDHKDSCLGTPPGMNVDANGCDIIPSDAIKVHVLTPSCIGSSDGVIEINMNLSGYLLDVSISGEGLANQFDDTPSETGLKINNLSVGSYSITVSIPEIFFEQTFGVNVNELDSVTGKRTNLNAAEGSVTYTVQGSKLYDVLVNGKTRSFSFTDSGPRTISLKNLEGQTEIAISGESDCQGKVSDNFFIGNGIQVYPTVTSSHVGFFTEGNQLNVRAFSLDGRLVKELSYNQSEKSMDVSSLEAGLYFLQMEMEGRTETIKIIKK